MYLNMYPQKSVEFLLHPSKSTLVEEGKVIPDKVTM